MLQEFKAFITRGNVMDLAVGVIIGTAFSKIVSSLVDDVIMPPIGLLLGGVDFSNLFITLDGKTYESVAKAQAAGAAIIKYGMFINTVIQFLIVSFVIFLLIEQVGKLIPHKQKEPPPVMSKDCPFCLTSIHKEAKRCPNCTSSLTEQAA